MVNEGASCNNSSCGVFGSNSFSSPGTLACPPGSYITSVSGKSGADINQLNSITCRNIITGAVTAPQSQQNLGSSSGGNPVSGVAGGNDGLSGFQIRAETEVEGLNPLFRGANAKNCCGSSTYQSGKFGNQSGMGTFLCPNNQLVNSIAGATSSHDAYLAHMSFSCKDFATMANIGNNPLNCCIGADTSQECLDVRDSLGCPAVVNNYCSQGTNIFTDQKCLNAAAKPDSYNGLDATTVANLKLKNCGQGKNFTSDNCSAFCTAKTGADIPITNTNTDLMLKGSTIKDGCNTLYNTQCAIDSSPAVCGCQRPWTSYSQYQQIPDKAIYPKTPQCYFSECRNFGYFSQPLTAFACPTCIQYQSLTVDNSEAILNNIQQNCEQNGNTASNTIGATATPSASVSSSTTPASTTQTSSNSKTIIIIIIAALFACCIFGGLAFALLA